MNEFEKPKIQPEAPLESEDLEGKRVCMSCNKILGEFNGEGTTHGVCSECKAKYDARDPEFMQKIKENSRQIRKETKLDDFILESCQEMIDITQDPFLTHQQKLEKLKDNLPMFNAQSMSIITMNSTPEHLEEAVKRLKKGMEVRRTILMKRLEE